MSKQPGPDTEVGSSVHVDTRKWVDGSTNVTAEHWQVPAHWLGVDEHGIWLGLSTGAISAKPTWSFPFPYPHVKLITDTGWSANICRPPSGQRAAVVYADMITYPEWTAVDAGHRVTMIDLDLDVISWNDGSIMIDDEDEFEDHQSRCRYPAEAITLAREACAEVENLLRQGSEPFNQVADRWLAQVR